MNYFLGYLVAGVIVTALRYAAIALAAKRFPTLRTNALEHGCGVFICSVPVWPIDLLLSAYRGVMFCGALWSAWRTAKRMGVELGK